MTVIKDAPGIQVGQYLGRYDITDILGRGSSGTVYLGRHIYLNKQVAIKMLDQSCDRRTFEEQGRDPNGWARKLLEEASILQSFEHSEHILPVYDFDLIGSHAFVVMAYAPEGTLRSFYGDRCVPLPLALQYIQQTAQAAMELHQRKIVHRDIKPENLLLKHEGYLWLGDFGTFTPEYELWEAPHNLSAGTPPYMAPEQINGCPVVASDQYALGCLFFEMLAGQYPFQGNNDQIMYQHLYGDPPSLCELVPGLPAAVDQVMFKVLSKHPEDRYTNVMEFAQALERACQPALTQAKNEESAPRRIVVPEENSTEQPVISLARLRDPKAIGYRFLAFLIFDLLLSGIALIVSLSLKLSEVLWLAPLCCFIALSFLRAFGLKSHWAGLLTGGIIGLCLFIQMRTQSPIAFIVFYTLSLLISAWLKRFFVDIDQLRR